MLYGFNGRTAGASGQLSGLGIIGYDAPCVDQFKDDLGNEFSWQKKEPAEAIIIVPEEKVEIQGKVNEVAINANNSPPDTNPTQDSDLLVSLMSAQEANDEGDPDLNIWLIILPIAITVVLIALLVFGIKHCIKNRKRGGVQE